MGRHKKDKPPKTDLLHFHTKVEAAEHYGVSVRTIGRWLVSYDEYHPMKNFGSHKLNLQKAKEIRHLHVVGHSIKELAKKYNVTFSAVSRIIHNITYAENTKETAIVSAVYNLS